MLEGFEGEPKEDDGVEEAVQTMGPEDLQEKLNRGEPKTDEKEGDEGEEEEGEQRGKAEAAGEEVEDGLSSCKRGEKKEGKRVPAGEGGRGAVAPAFQVTLDPSLLCSPSARLSGGFVRASQLNGHPADRHAVCPLCVLW